MPPRTNGGLTYGPSWDAWLAEIETAEQQCWEDWNAEHFQPLHGYEPHSQLILAHTDGGARHFLDGRPVHAGAQLELLLDDGHWLPVSYEWSWQADEAPTASIALGLPRAAQEVTEPPVASFQLPPRAILRWPEHHQHVET